MVGWYLRERWYLAPNTVIPTPTHLSLMLSVAGAEFVVFGIELAENMTVFSCLAWSLSGLDGSMLSLIHI